MAVQNIEVSTESILSAVVRLPEKEVDKLFKDAKKLKKREAELVKKLKEIDLSAKEQKEYGNLLEKFRAENITPKEHEKLCNFNDKLESIAAQRLEWLIEISQIRGQSVEEIMKELEIKPKNYG